jgi:hypothetical protein
MARFRRFALVGVGIVLVFEITAYLTICNFMDSVE